MLVTSNRLLLFLLLWVFTSCSDSRVYKIKFGDVGRLGEGDKVFIRGVHVGQVEDLTVGENEKMIVTISITKGIKVTEGSRFILQSELLGSQRIEIELADINNELVDPEHLQVGEVRPVDTTGFRKLTKAEYDSIIQTNPAAKLADSIQKIFRTIYKDKKKSGE